MITLNIGCGDRTFDEYPKGYKCINYDKRSKLKKVDVVGDVRALPFPADYFDYILASDIIEHFKIAEVDNILKEWVRVLKINCFIEFRLPNFEAIVTDYLNRKDDNRKDMVGVPVCHFFSWLIFGGQDMENDLNVHYTGYDRRFFRYVCENNGMNEVTWEKSGYNMIVKMRKT
jgi:predicted SAM-dependent methyltransferase